MISLTRRKRGKSPKEGQEVVVCLLNNKFNILRPETKNRERFKRRNENNTSNNRKFSSSQDNPDHNISHHSQL